MVNTVAELKRLAEGREAEIFEWEAGRVLRLFRGPRDAASLERESAAMEAVRAVVPLVPVVYGITELGGRPGIIMERIEGGDLLSVIASKPWTVWRAGSTAGAVQAQLHAVPAPASIVPLRERAQLVTRSPLVPPEIAAWATARLATMPDGDALLHGDFHPANILMTPSGPVVIDWPNVTRGHPDADLARSVLMIRMGSLPPGSPLVIRLGARVARRLLSIAHLRAYRRGRPVDMASIERWLELRAVDRLAENIVEERPALLAIIQRAMSRDAETRG